MNCNLYRKNSHILTPIVSIIVPIHNLENYLSRCIESILNQAFRNFQLILINDGSVDSSGIICDEYATKDSRIQVLHQTNLGVSAARNKGLEYSKGKYISFIDGDDWIDSTFYSKLMEQLSNFPNVDIVITGYKKDFSDGTSVQNFKKNDPQILTKESAINMMLEKQYFAWELCDKIYKKTLFKDCKFNITLANGEDFAINCQLFSKARQIFYYPLNAYHYYMRANSITHTLYDGKKTFLDAIDDVLSGNLPFDKKVKKHLLHKYFKCCIRNIFQMFFWDEIAYKKLILWHIKRLNLHIKNMEKYISFSKDELLLVKIYTGGYFSCKNYFIKIYSNFCHHLKKITSEHNSIYIYGAGIVGQHIYEIFSREKFKCSGFVISNGQAIPILKKEVPILYLSQINIQNNNFFVLGMDTKNKKTVEKILTIHNYKNFYWPRFCRLF